MLVGTLICGGEKTEFYKDEKEYYILLNGNKEKVSKLCVADLVSDSWSEDSIYDNFKILEDKTVICERTIIIYDWIEFVLLS